MTFDLFKLHDFHIDKGPNSWICAAGKGLYSKINNLLMDLEKTYSKKKISDIISRKLCCNNSIIEKRFYNMKNWFPLPIIIELLNAWKLELNKSDSDYLAKKEEINNIFEFLKVNCSLSKKVKAVKIISRDLAKICGAHAADGWMNFRYRPNLGYSFQYALREGYFRAVLRFQIWLKKVFELNTKITHGRCGDCYSIEFDNKVIIRFLHVFLDFPYGEKSNIVDMPEIIKKANISIKKAFALGVMTFDGCVGKSRIELMIKSKALRDSIWEVIQTDNLRGTSTNYPDKYNRWRFYSSYTFHKVSTWLDYFEISSEKHIKLLNQIVQNKENNYKYNRHT